MSSRERIHFIVATPVANDHARIGIELDSLLSVIIQHKHESPGSGMANKDRGESWPKQENRKALDRTDARVSRHFVQPEQDCYATMTRRAFRSVTVLVPIHFLILTRPRCPSQD